MVTELQKQKRHEYYLKNKEAIKEYQKKYYEKNKEAVIARQVIINRNNPNLAENLKRYFATEKGKIAKRKHSNIYYMKNREVVLEKQWRKSVQRRVSAGKDVAKFIKVYDTYVKIQSHTDRVTISKLDDNGNPNPELLKSVAAFLNSDGNDIYGKKEEIL